MIKWHSGPCSKWILRQTPSTVVVNPPWGLRLLNEEGSAEAARDHAGAIALRVVFVTASFHCYYIVTVQCAGIHVKPHIRD